MPNRQRILIVDDDTEMRDAAFASTPIRASSTYRRDIVSGVRRLKIFIEIPKA
jgi:hypothetical protein